MKPCFSFFLSLTFLTFANHLLGQGTAFTYQGQLTSSGANVTGLYDFQFAVFDAVSGGDQVGGTLITNAVGVTNGLFTVTLDFGPGIFTGDARWLDLAAHTNDSPVAFVSMVPRQQLTPTPYAVLAGGLSAAAQINFAGLNIQQNTFRGAPNIIEGSAANYVSGAVGATISGGGATNYFGYASTNSVTADFGTVSGGLQNTVSGALAVIGGGGQNLASFDAATVGGGQGNISSSGGSVVSGGFDNTASGGYAAISGGLDNIASQSGATVGGGEDNTASDFDTVVGGGNGNTASGRGAVVSGGGVDQTGVPGGNTASGSAATVPGGINNLASGNYSFAAGQQAQALNDGAFAWADSQNSTFSSTANDQFLIRARGGVGIGTNSPAAQLEVASGGSQTSPQLRLDQTTDGDYARIRMVSGSSSGVWDIAAGGSSPHVLNFFASPTAGGSGTNILSLQANGNANLWGTLAQGSDRAHKENFKAIDPQTVLAKVAAMPITEWNYLTDAGALHLGPMAQDFYAAFSLGADDKHITTIDEGGVALAAIQGLNQKLNEKDAAIERQAAEISELKARLNALEKMVLGQKH